MVGLSAHILCSNMSRVQPYIDDMNLTLSPRYYIAETTIWLLGAILVVSRLVGLVPSQPLPLLNVTIKDPQYFSRIVAALLVAVVLYLIVEWKQSPRISRDSYWAQARAVVTALWICVSLWLSYPLITANTHFVDISPAWYIGFLAIGFLLGALVSILMFASLMIRTMTEAKAHGFHRIPVATQAQYKTWIPVVAFLLVAYYVLWHFSPEAIKGIGAFIVGGPYLFMISEGFASLCLSKDENGNHISYAKRIEQFKKIHDAHDYTYLLSHISDKDIEEEKLIDATPQATQMAIQERFSVGSSESPVPFHVQQLEETQFRFYSKDGDIENQSLENRGVKIQKQQGKKGLLRVRVIFIDTDTKPREIEIQISLIEKHAGEYLIIHTDDADLTFRNVISYAINQTVMQTMVEQEELSLYRLVEAGQECQVEEFLKQDMDVNERAKYGWTALLIASAQRYPRIARLLLDAGANPDLQNDLGATPLMFVAQYGNADTCRLLLEHGANTDLQDTLGRTALIVATREGFADVVAMLLRDGANAAIKDRNGMTALDYAHKCKRGNIARSIRAVDKSRRATKRTK